MSEVKKYKSNLPEITIKYKTGEQKKSKISSSKDCYNVLKDLFNTDTIEYCEEMILILLNRNNATLGWYKVSQGGISGTICDPKIIFTVALQTGASSIILAHNHPSGNLTPSQSDINLTKKIKEAGKILDISVLDHLIVSSNGYKSLADDGYIL
jgi:DNA repair protein RadC